MGERERYTRAGRERAEQEREWEHAEFWRARPDLLINVQIHALRTARILQRAGIPAGLEAPRIPDFGRPQRQRARSLDAFYAEQGRPHWRAEFANQIRGRAILEALYWQDWKRQWEFPDGFNGRRYCVAHSRLACRACDFSFSDWQQRPQRFDLPENRLEALQIPSKRGGRSARS
jgi:hypothetical protein